MEIYCFYLFLERSSSIDSDIDNQEIMDSSTVKSGFSK